MGQDKKPQVHKLTPKQDKFCQEYLKTGNASEAYRLVYNISKMKPASIHRKAKELLDNVKVTARINEIQLPALQETEITIEKTLRETARLAFADPRKLYDAKGNLKDIHDLDDETAACIGGLTFDVDKEGNQYVKNIKIWDKNSALEKLGKHFKLFTDKLEIEKKVRVLILNV